MDQVLNGFSCLLSLSLIVSADVVFICIMQYVCSWSLAEVRNFPVSVAHNAIVLTTATPEFKQACIKNVSFNTNKQIRVRYFGKVSKRQESWGRLKADTVEHAILKIYVLDVFII